MILIILPGVLHHLYEKEFNEDCINGFLKNSLKISRADLAHFMINNIDNQATYKSIIEIGY